MKNNIFKNNLSKVIVAHFLLILGYLTQTIIYDASKLITPDRVLEKWFVAASFATVLAFAWYVCRNVSKLSHLQILTWVIIFADLLFASFNVYVQRGMASKSVILFVIPIVVAGILASRVALFATATMAAALYSLMNVAYFVNYFNEGYKVELYGESIFYGFIFFIFSALIWIVIKTKRQ